MHARGCGIDPQPDASPSEGALQPLAEEASGLVHHLEEVRAAPSVEDQVPENPPGLLEERMAREHIDLGALAVELAGHTGSRAVAGLQGRTAAEPSRPWDQGSAAEPTASERTCWMVAGQLAAHCMATRLEVPWGSPAAEERQLVVGEARTD